MTVVETQRLTGERIEARHLSLMITMHRNSDIMATLGGLRDDETTKRNLDWNIKQWKDFGHGLWIFNDRATSQFIGRGGLRRVTVDGQIETEVGYALVPEVWGKGLATEIAQLSVRVGFEDFKYSDLVCFTITTNKASERVMQKSGFKFEKEIVHADLPHVLYRLTKEEWAGLRS